MDEKYIKEMLEELSDTLNGLASSVLCPACNKVVRAPFFNLGEKYHWAEGCKDCFDKENNNLDK